MGEYPQLSQPYRSFGCAVQTRHKTHYPATVAHHQAPCFPRLRTSWNAIMRTSTGFPSQRFSFQVGHLRTPDVGAREETCAEVEGRGCGGDDGRGRANESGFQPHECRAPAGWEMTLRGLTNDSGRARSPHLYCSMQAFYYPTIRPPRLSIMLHTAHVLSSSEEIAQWLE